jgi:hypothetical protein
MSRIVLRDVRFTYAWLDKPRQPKPGSKQSPKYVLTAIVPKDHPQAAELRTMVKAFAESKFGTNLKGVKNPIKDGDSKDPETGQPNFGPEFAGAWAVTANNAEQPEIMCYSTRIPPRNRADLRWGNYASLKLACGAYEVDGSRGVKLYLNGVWILRQGDALGGDQDWGDGHNAASAPPTGAASAPPASQGSQGGQGSASSGDRASPPPADDDAF